MDFGNFKVRRELEQMVSPTGVAAMLVYVFYPKFANEPERDPWVMVKVIRYIVRNSPIPCSDDHMEMYYYCNAIAVFRNAVMHNQKYDDVLECYRSFAGQHSVRD